MSGETKVTDWTAGGEAVAYQSCGACGHVWYFRRGFCPACGSGEPAMLQAAGEGAVHAISIVTRAATPEARTHGPYAVVLVDMREGFRMMGHGDRDLAIGDRVTATYRTFTGQMVPYFVKA